MELHVQAFDIQDYSFYNGRYVAGRSNTRSRRETTQMKKPTEEELRTEVVIAARAFIEVVPKLSLWPGSAKSEAYKGLKHAVKKYESARGKS